MDVPRLRRECRESGPLVRGLSVPEWVGPAQHHGSSAGSDVGWVAFLPSCRCFTSAYSGNHDQRKGRVDDTIPPTIGAAMRRITSEPVPVLHMIGNRPAMIATTVIILGAPVPRRLDDRFAQVAGVQGGLRSPPRGIAFQCVVEIDQHDHAGFRGDARQRDEADGDRDLTLNGRGSHNSQTIPRPGAKGTDSITISDSVIRRKFR